jgi:hypothetical protein
MSTPHKATPDEWEKLRRWAEEQSSPLHYRVLLEVADRVAAMEEASSDMTPHKATERRRRFASVAFCGDREYAICEEGRLWYNGYNPGGCPWVEFSALPEIEDPAGPADHSRGAPEMVATDEELWSLYDTRRLQDGSTTAALCAVYNLGREHSAQPRQEVDPSQLSDGYHTFAELYEHRHALFLALMRAMPQHCWFSLRHADGEKCFGGDDWFIAGAELPGGSSVTYHLPVDLYPLANATGASRLDLGRPWDGHTASDVVSRLMEWAASVDPLKEVEPTQPPAPAGGLVEMVAEEIYYFTGDHVDDNEASAVIHAVADWLDTMMTTRVSAAVLRREADRSAALSPAQPASLTAPAGGLLEEMARLLANRISTMRPSADCTPLACAALCVVADAAEKMVPDPNLTWERVAIWLDMESKLEGRADG